MAAELTQGMCTHTYELPVIFLCRLIIVQYLTLSHVEGQRN